MRRRISRAGIALTAMALLVVFAFVMILVVPVVQARNLPEPDGTRVMDLAGVLDPDDEETLTAQMEELADNARLNVAVVTVDSLGGESAASMPGGYTDIGTWSGLGPTVACWCCWRPESARAMWQAEAPWPTG